ncbi:MAG: nucleotidyl transferase AbiEii/AbiGii toxin family protein [Candidatus Geothermarchaeales archaeon]
MLYEPYEIEISQKTLEKIFKYLRRFFCLLGGWAVYLTVNDNFKSSEGRDYTGSRDIDLGFHIDKNWGDEQLIESPFAHSLSTLKELRFKPISFRLVKHFHKETREELGEEAKRISPHLIFSLYVDPVVDFIHPSIKETFGFTPVDEPLLSLVFEENLFKSDNIFGTRTMLPLPEMLLATKLSAVLMRDEEHKRIKDICDIYSLLWYSDEELKSLKKKLHTIYSEKKTKEVASSFNKRDLLRVSRVLGIETELIETVLSELL